MGFLLRAYSSGFLRSGCDERGVALLETALFLPVLFLIAFSVVNIGIPLRDQVSLIEAARNGARAAARYRPVTANPSQELCRVATSTVSEYLNYAGVEANIRIESILLQASVGTPPLPATRIIVEPTAEPGPVSRLLGAVRGGAAVVFVNESNVITGTDC